MVETGRPGLTFASGGFDPGLDLALLILKPVEGSSRNSTTACRGGSMEGPTMSSTGAAKSGSVERVKLRARCGFSCARPRRAGRSGTRSRPRQPRCGLYPRVTSAGGPEQVSASTLARGPRGRGGLPGGRVLVAQVAEAADRVAHANPSGRSGLYGGQEPGQPAAGSPAELDDAPGAEP
ncbi:hypothetical protein M446_0194 [Methylobacterium sp. 4-46]|nr:hypothetical protein M446_0194 [Methylobacterium sp. 4-46]